MAVRRRTFSTKSGDPTHKGANGDKVNREEFGKFVIRSYEKSVIYWK